MFAWSGVQRSLCGMEPSHGSHTRSAGPGGCVRSAVVSAWSDAHCGEGSPLESSHSSGANETSCRTEEKTPWPSATPIASVVKYEAVDPRAGAAREAAASASADDEAEAEADDALEDAASRIASRNFGF